VDWNSLTSLLSWSYTEIKLLVTEFNRKHFTSFTFLYLRPNCRRAADDIPAIPYSFNDWRSCSCDVTVRDFAALSRRRIVRRPTSFENNVGTAFGFNFLHPSCRCSSNWLDSKCFSQSLLEDFGCQPLPERPHLSSHKCARSGADGQRNRRTPSPCLFLQFVAEQDGILTTKSSEKLIQSYHINIVNNNNAKNIYDVLCIVANNRNRDGQIYLFL